MKSTLLRLFFLLALNALSACRSESTGENDAHLFADFYVRYLESERELKAYASLMTGDSLGNAHPLEPVGSVRFEGSPMETRRLANRNVRYVYSERDVAYTTPFEFQYRSTSGKPITQKVSLKPIRSFSVQRPVSLESGLALRTQGGSLTEEESLVLLFTQEDRSSKSITIAGPHPGDNYRLEGGQLSELSPGPVELYLVKRKVTVAEKRNGRITAEVEYYTRTEEIELKE